MAFDEKEYRKRYYQEHKAIMLARAIAWKKKNRARANAWSREYKRANRAKYRAAWKDYYRRNKEAIVARRSTPKFRAYLKRVAKAYYWANRDKHLAYAKAWQKAHPARTKARMAAWAKANREYKRRCDREYYAALTDEEKAQWIAKAKAWAKANPEKTRAFTAAANARRREAFRATSKEERAEVREFYLFVRTVKRIKCVYCKKWIPKRKRHVDHAIPLIRGGRHIRSNLVCACVSCNCHKSAKLPHEFTGQHELFAGTESVRTKIRN